MLGIPRVPRSEGSSSECGSTLLPARIGARGDLLDPVVCTARPQYDHDNKPKPHRGKHRTTLLNGVRLRWTDGEALIPSTKIRKKTPA